MNKQELRKYYTSVRKSIADKAAKDSAIEEKLQVLASGHDSIFCYVSFGSEVSTHEFIRKNAEKIYIPYTEGGNMKCLKYLGGDLCADKLGNIGRDCYGSEGFPTLSVVPMLAFNESCFRLGYGGGYYDRYLASAFTVKVGVAYDEQYTDEQFAELFDVGLDIIITPTEFYKR